MLAQEEPMPRHPMPSPVLLRLFRPSRINSPTCRLSDRGLHVAPLCEHRWAVPFIPTPTRVYKLYTVFINYLHTSCSTSCLWHGYWYECRSPIVADAQAWLAHPQLRAWHMPRCGRIRKGEAHLNKLNLSNPRDGLPF